MKANADYFHHYIALGLQPGASQKDIHSAYRRLAKQYHPDHDFSLDAEVRYHEIREAYDVLRHKVQAQHETASAERNSSPPPSGKHKNTAEDHRTVYGKDWWYVEDDDENENSFFDFSDLMGENGGVKRSKKRLPFSLKNLPGIFRLSFKEVFGVGMVIRVLLAAWGLWATLTWVGWGGMWKTGMILCVLLVALLYRYYFQYSWGWFQAANVVGSLLCSVALSILCTATTHQTSVYILFAGRYSVPNRYESDVFPHLVMVIFIWLYFLWGRPQSWFIWKYLGSRRDSSMWGRWY